MDEFRPKFEARGCALASILRAGLPLLNHFSLLRHRTAISEWVPFVPMQRPTRGVRPLDVYQYACVSYV